MFSTESMSPTRYRVTLIAAAVVASLATLLVLGGVALATNGATEFSGCLTNKGELVEVAEGPTPAKACKDKQTEVHWPSQSAHDALEARVTELEGLLAAVSYDGTTVTVTGNLQVVNGTGTTGGAPNGEGNVIIGYNTDNSDDKSGSHYLVVGDSHTYTQHSGIVVGFDNTVTGSLASVAGGNNNTASGLESSVGGGSNNIASGTESSVGGGDDNIASGLGSFVGGGDTNIASGLRSFAAGDDNTASGNESFVGGGDGNTASGNDSFVGGGRGDTAGPGTCAWIANINVVAC